MGEAENKGKCSQAPKAYRYPQNMPVLVGVATLTWVLMFMYVLYLIQFFVDVAVLILMTLALAAYAYRLAKSIQVSELTPE